MGFYVVQFLTGLASASALFLVASGLSIIFGVTRVVNFAHGSFYMLGAFIGASVSDAIGGAGGFALGLLGAALGVGLVGVLVELTVLRRVYRAPELFQLVATFGVILVIQDAALFVWGPEDRLGPRVPGLDGVVDVLGTPMPTYDLALIAIAPLVLGALWLLFHRTRFGVLVRAATEDREMVGALGVNQALLFTAAFFLGSLLAGLGGAAQLPKGGADLLMDFNILAAVFVVVVIGGMGSIVGAYLAAVLVAQVGTFGVLVLPQSTLVAMFVVMALVLVVRPWGLLGRPEAPGQHGEVGPLEAPIEAAGGRLRALYAVLAALAIALPWLADEFALVLGTEIAVMVLLAVSLHFVMGPGGLVSFGHAAFFGGGAYAAALLVQYADAPMEAALVAAPACAGLLALLIGWFAVRLSGVYLAMLTLAFAQIVWSIVFQWNEVTGGDDGIIGVWPADWAADTATFYHLVLFLTLAGIGFIWHVLHSPFGYALRACRDSRLRSDAIGIDVRRTQWTAFAVSGAVAGLAGALFAYSKGSVFPTELEIARSFDALLMVLLGGVKTVTGPISGAAAFTWLHDEVSRFEYWRALFGVLILVIVIAFPQGISGFARAAFGRAFGLREVAGR